MFGLYCHSTINALRVDTERADQWQGCIPANGNPKDP